jgi:protocatechuate 3,4-dioxygenase beta subunit
MSEQTKTKKLMTRRQTFGIAGLAGAGYVASRAAGFGDGSVSDGLTTAPADAATCTLAPEVTEGPFWVDEKLNRSDVTDGQSGVPLAITLNIVDSDDECSAYAGATVDIWHANPDGNYSDEPAGMGNDDTQGQTFLRGYQVSDAKGQVTFQTIYPGFYSGRTVHIHVRIRTFDGNSTTTNFTTQLFFDEATNNTVFASGNYSGGTRNTTNGSDMVYAEEQQDGNILLVPLTGSVANGYKGSVTVALSGLPASATGGSNDTTVDAKLTHVNFADRNGNRRLKLKIAADEAVKAEANVVRGNDTVAHKTIDKLKGTKTLEVPIKDSVDAGSAKLEVTLTDKVGNVHKLSRRVTIPA